MLRSLAATFFDRAKSHCDVLALRYKDGRSAYKEMTWGVFGHITREIACGLASVGLESGQCVAIFSNNSHMWVAADYATIANGAASVPIYPTSSTSDIAFILSNSQACFAFVQNDKLLKRLLQAREQLPQLKKIIVLNHPEQQSLSQLGMSLGLDEQTAQGLLLNVDTLRQLGRELLDKQPDLIEQRIAATNVEDLATIIYTSGTTGVPKGVQLTHLNIFTVIAELPGIFPISDSDVYLSYLPMSHVFERVCGEFYWTQKGGVIAFAESIEMMAKNLAETDPTMVLVVPRVLDRIYAKVRSGIDGATGRAKKLIEWSIYVGKENIRTKAKGEKPSIGLRAKLWLAETLVFKKLRQRIGPRLRMIISGGAPATPHVIEFFNAIGIQTLEGYGLTETTAPACVNRIDHVKIGSVGTMLPCVKVRIADDGEILLKGDSIFKGYYKNNEATNDSFEDGWFKTGDIGCLDGDGYLRITDRKKDLIINAAGKNIAPQRIEAVLKTIPYVAQAVVFGDKQKHLVAIITLDEQAVSEFAREKNWQSESYEELVKNPQLKQYIRKEIQLRSGQLAEYEQIRRFEILPDDLSVEAGELTATLKVKRKIIAKKYADVIDKLFREDRTGDQDKEQSKVAIPASPDPLAERSR